MHETCAQSKKDECGNVEERTSVNGGTEVVLCSNVVAVLDGKLGLAALADGGELLAEESEFEFRGNAALARIGDGRAAGS